MGGEVGAEGERMSVLSSLCPEHRAHYGAQSPHPKIMTLVETKGWTFNQLSHTGAGVEVILNVCPVCSLLWKIFTPKYLAY